MKTIFSLIAMSIALLTINEVRDATCQSNAAASDLAAQAVNSNNKVGQPVFGLSGSGGGNNGRNWNAAGSLGAGAKVWESQNGRHAFGAGANVGQAAGRFQGQSWKSRPDVGVGASYRYRFGK